VSLQLRGATQQPPLSVQQRSAAVRLITLQLLDPAMKLQDLVAQIHILVIGPSSPSSSPDPSAMHPTSGTASGAGAGVTEAMIKTTFLRIVDPGSDAFRSLKSSMTTALACRLLHGPETASGQVGAAMNGLLARCGAVAVVEEVMGLADEIALVAAAGEAVHEDIYKALLMVDEL
jgi:T-complex protein 11